MNEALLVHDAGVDLAGGRIAKPQLRKGAFAVGMGALTIVETQHRDWFEWPPLETKQNWGDHKFYSRSIQGAVIRSLAKGWGCSLELVLKASSFGSDEETFEKEVGTLAGKPYVEDVNIIRRP